MSKLSYVSQLVLDLLFQDYATDVNFIQIPHVNFLIGAYYNTLLVKDYQDSKKENFAENGFIYPTFSQEVMRKVDLETNIDGDFKYCQIDNVVSYPFDQNSYGIVGVRCIKNKICGDFKRTKASMKDKFCSGIIPFTNTVWFWLEANRLYFYSAKEIPDKVTVTLIPTVDSNDNDFEIPQSYQQVLINGVLQILKQAASGVVIDVTNDSNPNKVLQSEINEVFAKRTSNLNR